jgi:hypothetical protein
VVIPPVVNLDRRIACLADPVLFLKTYGARTFYNPFAAYHLGMIQAIVERAKTGGDKAVAAPRGSGKTQVAAWMTVYILLAGFVRFPIVVASTRKHAQRIFKQIKASLQSELLIDDFPEIGACISGLDGAPQRAAKQHVQGVKTNIIWTQDEIGLPSVPGSIYGGRYCTYFGLDSAIRGVHFNGVRPDYALIDDPETREVAFSDEQHFAVEEMIDSDIAGLCGPNNRIARVVLTTIQNRRCYSWRVCNPKIKPTFAGERYGVLSSWPERMDLWEEYIGKRQACQAEGDKDGRKATEDYAANREEMDRGSVVTDPHRFTSQCGDDGQPIELSPVQMIFNRIADLGKDRTLAEYQNDPVEEETIESLRLTPGTVGSRMSGLSRHELPKESDLMVVVGLDIGKYFSHWVKVACYGNGIGHVIDYGVLETYGLTTQSDEKAIELAILKSLEMWRLDILSANEPRAVFVDTGDYSPAVYEFIRRSGIPFFASKGWEGGRLEMSGKNTDTRLFFDQCRADFQPSHGLWLYNFDSEYWKQQVHQRFLTQTYNEAQIINEGSLSIWSTDDRKEHLAYTHHICAEERTEKFVEGKGLVRKWEKKHKNNHWLDATAMAICAAGVMGMRIIPRVTQTQPTQQAQKTPQPSRFIQRPGGWLKGLRR